MPKIIICFAGLAVFLFVLGTYLVLTEKKRLIGKRLQDAIHAEDLAIAEEIKEKQGRSRRQRFLRSLGSIFTPRSFGNHLEEELLKADILLRGEEFIAIILIAVAVGSVLGYLINGLSAGFVFALLGLVGPMVFLQRKKKARLAKLNDQMGDCLIIMSNSLRAGFSFIQTLDQVGKEIPPPLGTEFSRTTREVGLGITAEDALKAMARRVESDDLDLMITAVLIQRQIGGNLAEILDNISHTVRERVRIKGEIRTLTAQARISGWVIALLPVFLFGVLMVINPEYMGFFFQRKIGLLILVGAVVSELFGMFIISRIVKIEM